jgi:hypothetical protein
MRYQQRDIDQVEAPGDHHAEGGSEDVLVRAGALEARQ